MPLTDSRLQRDIFPFLGAKAVADISAPDLLAVVRKIEERGALESAHRTLSICGQVCRYAVATGRTQRDITADLRGALPPLRLLPLFLARLLQKLFWRKILRICARSPLARLRERGGREGWLREDR